MIALGAQAGESFYSRGGLGMHNGGLRGASGTRSFRYVGRASALWSLREAWQDPNARSQK
jgi:hypothetical protein